MKVSRLHLFTAAFNVQDHLLTLERGLLDLHAVLTSRGCELNVLVIDDKSKDDTLSMLQAMQKRLGNRFSFEILANPENLGVADNLIFGYRWATKDANPETVVAVIDSDGEHNPLSIPRHLDWIENEDFDGIIGCVEYPGHLVSDDDRHMMHFCGPMQSRLAGLNDDPDKFTIQSPGYQIYRSAFVTDLIHISLPKYHQFFEANYGPYPRWDNTASSPF